MNEEEPLENEFADHLVALDEALAAGSSLLATDTPSPANDGTRLAKGLACLKLMRQYGKARQAPQTTAIRQSTPRSGVGASNPQFDGGEPERPIHRLGRFEIRRELGRGGYGVVFLAYDPQLCREVALKVPRAEAIVEPGLVARFKHEARAAAGLEHPHIVQVYEAGDLGPICYMASAFCPGINLADWIQRRKAKVPCVEAAQLLATLAEAIEHAHQRGVLHRDLKPANVILQFPERHELEVESGDSAASAVDVIPLGSFHPKITDFGLALTLEASTQNTISGTIVGTPNYMAPEQAAGRKTQLGPAADVYSLGTILYELLTDRVPFHGDRPLETLQQVLTTDPVPPARLRPSIPRDLNTICLKCLEKEPHKRYRTAQQLADDLRRFLRHEPILARPVSSLERGWRWCRRRPWEAVLMACLVFAVVSGVAGVFWQWRRAEQRRIDTVDALQQVRIAHRDVSAQRDRSNTMLYLHDVALAHHEYLEHDSDRADQLLAGCQPELRNWEWYYLAALCHGDVRTFGQHELPVVAAAVSPDGRLVASASGRWGKDLAGDLKIWDVATGECLSVFPGQRGSLLDVAFHPDGKSVAVAEVVWGSRVGGGVSIWHLETGQEQRISGTGSAFSVGYSRDGSRLAIGGSDARVTVVDSVTGERQQVIARHTGNIFAVSFHPDGKRVATASRDGTARVFNVETGEELLSFTDLGDVRSVSFSQDGRSLAVGAWTGHFFVWDLERHSKVAEHHVRPGGLRSFSLSPDGQSVAIVSRPNGLELWDIQSGGFLREFSAHGTSPNCLVYSPDGASVVSGGGDGKVKMWDLTAEPEPRVITVQRPHIADVAIVPGKQLLALAPKRNSSSYGYGDGDYSIKLWNADRLRNSRTLKGHTDWLTSLAASADGQWLVSGSDDYTVRIWSTSDDEPVHTLTGHHARVSCVDFLGDQRHIVSAGQDDSMRVWEIASGKEWEAGRVKAAGIQCLAGAPGNSWYASGGSDGFLRVWDPLTGRELNRVHGHTAKITLLAFSPGGEWLATAGGDTVIRLWDARQLAAGVPVSPIQSLHGNRGLVADLCFAPDGKRIASMSANENSLLLWDVSSGQEALRLPKDGPEGFVRFSDDGQRLYAVSGNQVRIYNAQRQLLPAAEKLAVVTKRTPVWHREQAQSAADSRRWSAALWHLDRALAQNPNDALALTQRGDAYAEIQQWDLASRDFRQALEVDQKETFIFYQLAMTRLGANDFPGYRTVCEEMLMKHANTRDPFVANNIAWTCAVTPPNESDLPWLVDLASFARDKAPSLADSYKFQNTLALALYRAGRYGESLSILQQALKDQRRGGDTRDWLLFALIYQGLQKPSLSSKWLQRAQQALTTVPAAGLDLPSRLAWNERLENEWFFREASATINPP